MAAKKEQVQIAPPNLQAVVFHIRGSAPYVQNKFSQKAREKMRQQQERGHVGKKGQAKDPKDFEALCEGAKHKSVDGWCGIPASAFRAGLISACRMVGFTMTRAKLSLFVLADGFDADDGTPLVKITKGEPSYAEHAVRNESGVCDIRPRPMWREGWEAAVTIQYDRDQFSLDDVTNLLMRVGVQVGIGEGRPDSKKSTGMGWGLFELIGKEN